MTREKFEYFSRDEWKVQDLNLVSFILEASGLEATHRVKQSVQSISNKGKCRATWPLKGREIERKQAWEDWDRKRVKMQANF